MGMNPGYTYSVIQILENKKLDVSSDPTWKQKLYLESIQYGNVSSIGTKWRYYDIVFKGWLNMSPFSKSWKHLYIYNLESLLEKRKAKTWGQGARRGDLGTVKGERFQVTGERQWFKKQRKLWINYIEKILKCVRSVWRTTLCVRKQAEGRRSLP